MQRNDAIAIYKYIFMIINYCSFHCGIKHIPMGYNIVVHNLRAPELKIIRKLFIRFIERCDNVCSR